MNEVVVWYQISKIDLYVLSGIANEQLKLNAVLEGIKLHDNSNDDPLKVFTQCGAMFAYITIRRIKKN